MYHDQASKRSFWYDNRRWHSHEIFWLEWILSRILCQFSIVNCRLSIVWILKHGTSTWHIQAHSNRLNRQANNFSFELRSQGTRMKPPKFKSGQWKCGPCAAGTQGPQTKVRLPPLKTSLVETRAMGELTDSHLPLFARISGITLLYWEFLQDLYFHSLPRPSVLAPCFLSSTTPCLAFPVRQFLWSLWHDKSLQTCKFQRATGIGRNGFTAAIPLTKACWGLWDCKLVELAPNMAISCISNP